MRISQLAQSASLLVDGNFVEAKPRTKPPAQVNRSAGVVHVEVAPFDVAVFKKKVAAARRTIAGAMVGGRHLFAVALSEPIHIALIVVDVPASGPLKTVDHNRRVLVAAAHFLARNAPSANAVDVVFDTRFVLAMRKVKIAGEYPSRNGVIL